MSLPNLYHLRYFLDAVELGSISAAAQKNLVTHPAISRAISALEIQFDLKLLKHKKKSFEVTPEGFLVAQKAKTILSTAAHLISEAPTHAIFGKVSIGLSRTIGQAYLLPLLKEISKNYPGIKLHVSFGTADDILQKLIRGDIDVGLTIGHQLRPTLKQKLLKNGPFILIDSLKNRRQKSRVIENFLLTEPRYETELLKKNFYQKFRKRLQPIHEIESWDMIFELASKGVGIGLVPEIAVNPERKSKVTRLKADWFRCDYQIYLNYSAARNTAQATRVVIETIELLVK